METTKTKVECDKEMEELIKTLPQHSCSAYYRLWRRKFAKMPWLWRKRAEAPRLWRRAVVGVEVGVGRCGRGGGREKGRRPGRRGQNEFSGKPLINSNTGITREEPRSYGGVKETKGGDLLRKAMKLVLHHRSPKRHCPTPNRSAEMIDDALLHLRFLDLKLD
ncbi:hypothetical protein E3N88_00158 [Mikania micrantha]|uniref:Uncharacterized protein n=1 Tax=Mikania micrantha TaxID=192012 RepID=A0A5N6PXQ7_9ASTR|nr:hypothetical protein E3N88_00158 [Mikania micrantha]